VFGGGRLFRPDRGPSSPWSRSVVHSEIQHSLFHRARPCRRGAKLINFWHFSGRLVDEQLQFPAIFPVSREFATGSGSRTRARSWCNHPVQPPRVLNTQSLTVSAQSQPIRRCDLATGLAPAQNFGSSCRSFMSCAWRAKKLATVWKSFPSCRNASASNDEPRNLFWTNGANLLAHHVPIRQ